PANGPERAAATAAAPAATAPAPAATAPAATAPAPAATATAIATPVAVGPGADHDGDANARMTPAVRRLLREHGLEASQVPGTGGGGRITREDVIAVVEAQRTGTAVAAPTTSAPAAPAARPSGAPAAAINAGITFPAGADEVLVPMTQMRKGIAAQMTR